MKWIILGNFLLFFCFVVWTTLIPVMLADAVENWRNFLKTWRAK